VVLPRVRLVSGRGAALLSKTTSMDWGWYERQVIVLAQRACIHVFDVQHESKCVCCRPRIRRSVSRDFHQAPIVAFVSVN
jgi:hypothetical protein